MTDQRTPRGRLVLQVGTVAVLTVIAVVPIVGNQLRVADVDPQFMRDLIERMHRFGGTFYQNGIYNKGALEPVVYDVARHLGGYNGMWTVISAFAAMAALISAVVAGRTARWVGAPKALAFAVGIALYVHLTVSPSNYAGVLYARNMTTALLAVAWFLTFEDGCWRSKRARLVSAIALGVALGIVAQSLFTEALACAAIGIPALVLLAHRAAPEERVKLAATTIGSALAIFVGVPIWYVLRGSFAEYWASWFQDARLQSIGTQRTFASQLALGRHQIYNYYQHRPLALFLIVAFVVLTYAVWPGAGRKERAMHLGLLGWLAAAWVEQVLNQRYSAHYFVINTVPTALMAAVLVGRAGRAVLQDPRLARATVALPLITALGALYLSDGHGFMDAVKRTSHFTSGRATTQEATDNQSGAIRSARGVLDLVSRDNDAVLAWTNEASRYLDWHRVAAGRFIWESFLTGEVYLGAQGPQYVLPHTWEWFRQDIAQSKPVAFVQTSSPPRSDTPFARLVDSGFQLVFKGQQVVYLRNDVARAVVEPSATKPWTAPGAGPSGTGWTTAEGSATYHDSGLDRGSDALPVATRGCFRLDGTLAADQGGLPAVDFRLENTTAKAQTLLKVEPLHLRIAGDKATSASDVVEYESVPSGIDPASSTPATFSLIVGRRAAVLVVNGQVRAALRLPAPVRVTMTASAPSVDLGDLRVGAAPPTSGC